MRTLVWYRGKDLRVADHAPLRAALDGGEVIPLFVLDPYFFAPERARAMPHRIQFLLASIEALADELRRLGSRLIVVRGKAVDVVPALAKRWRVDRVVAHRWIEPFGRERDARVAARAPLTLFEGETLQPPGTLRNGEGAPYRVFTSFARRFREVAAIAPPLPAPRELPPVPRDVKADEVPIPSCADLGIIANPRVVEGGEAAARARLKRFVRIADDYATARDRMDQAGTSRLSQDLKFGTLSARAIWHAVDDDKFRSELIWREFTHATLWDRPALLEEPFRPEWKGFPWRRDAAAWRAWCEGRTGYPLVDAAARQLLAEGFVHNRARMIAASFLTKHLLLDYKLGEAHYLRWLTDGDWAQNNAGWQWSAGCGCDAQPYFRVFNPSAQAARFDPDGAYVRRWVPEAGTKAYPPPIVDHAAARARFLATAKAHLRANRSSVRGPRGAG